MKKKRPRPLLSAWNAEERQRRWSRRSSKVSRPVAGQRFEPAGKVGQLEMRRNEGSAKVQATLVNHREENSEHPVDEGGSGMALQQCPEPALIVNGARAVSNAARNERSGQQRGQRLFSKDR
jgi:hypothetical protein